MGGKKTPFYRVDLEDVILNARIARPSNYSSKRVNLGPSSEITIVLSSTYVDSIFLDLLSGTVAFKLGDNPVWRELSKKDGYQVDVNVNTVTLKTNQVSAAILVDYTYY